MMETEQTSLETLLVTIQVLRVNGKKLTMAVFNQLPVEDVINERSGEVKGQVWGWVNFAVCGNGGHRHFVWQKGDELRRACVYPPQELDIEKLPEELARNVKHYREYYAHIMKKPQLFIGA